MRLPLNIAKYKYITPISFALVENNHLFHQSALLTSEYEGLTLVLTMLLVVL
jgi:hypothetical protein